MLGVYPRRAFRERVNVTELADGDAQRKRGIQLIAVGRPRRAFVAIPGGKRARELGGVVGNIQQVEPGAEHPFAGRLEGDLHLGSDVPCVDGPDELLLGCGGGVDAHGILSARRRSRHALRRPLRIEYRGDL
jgi:hypothetical protein